MEEKESYTKNIHQTSNSPKIYRPKPKKLCISYKLPKSLCNKKLKISKNKNYISNTNYILKNNIINDTKNKNIYKKNVNKNPKLDFNEISFEEIENDFTKLKARSEIIKVERELLYLLRNSTKDNSIEDEKKDNIKIKRPKNPFLKNIE